MAIGNTTATNGASTLIIDVTDTYQTVSVTNQGANTVWLSWGSAAVVDQGTRLLTNESKDIALAQGKFSLKMYAWADGSNCDIAWQTFSR